MDSLINNPGYDPQSLNLPPDFWLERWKNQRLARLAVPKFDSPHSFWNDKKKLKDHFIQNLDGWRSQAEERISSIGIRDGSRVLDVGAGTGNLSVPLAAHGCDVVAVEPGEAMGEALLVYQQQQQTSPITLIRKTWEEVDPAELGKPFDVVIASYSLMITDIGVAIRKMQAVCTGTIHLFWFLTQPLSSRLNSELWPLVHGTEFPGEPTAEILWQALYEMGIYANIAVEPGCEAAYFQTIDDAVKDFYQRLNCSDPKQEEIIRRYCEGSLVKNSNGYRVPGQALGAHIWWNVE
ncbi:methyltransferase domain-containing protein [uncultured Methanospirillum sp.]|uniref:class I SAM-dependent methyltransferase n=1 Tax=uncultured Methanospirillum sp. TaxID=262503 RepID=UPI0029C67878|nr:methyltransferase domain-containing protein [uncultured Methanospirillum sp.]